MKLDDLKAGLQTLFHAATIGRGRDMDIVEHMARALCRLDCGTDPDAPLTELPDGPQVAWQLYTDEARAVLAAMLEAVGEPVAWQADTETESWVDFEPTHGNGEEAVYTPLYSLAALREEV